MKFKSNTYLRLEVRGKLLKGDVIINDWETGLDVSDVKINQIDLFDFPCGHQMKLNILVKKSEEVLSEERFLQDYPCQPGEDIIFGFMGDTQGSIARHYRIGQVISQLSSDLTFSFILNSGDLVEQGFQERHWNRFFYGGSLYNKRYPLIAAMGNHDYYIPYDWDGHDEFDDDWDEPQPIDYLFYSYMRDYKTPEWDNEILNN